MAVFFSNWYEFKSNFDPEGLEICSRENSWDLFPDLRVLFASEDISPLQSILFTFLDRTVLIWEFWLCPGTAIFVVSSTLLVKEAFEEIYNAGRCIFALWSANATRGSPFFNLIISSATCVVTFHEVDLGSVAALGILSVKFRHYPMTRCKLDNQTVERKIVPCLLFRAARENFPMTKKKHNLTLLLDGKFGFCPRPKSCILSNYIEKDITAD